MALAILQRNEPMAAMAGKNQVPVGWRHIVLAPRCPTAHIRLGRFHYSMVTDP